jgi:hypothetical protein
VIHQVRSAVIRQCEDTQRTKPPRRAQQLAARHSSTPWETGATLLREREAYAAQGELLVYATQTTSSHAQMASGDSRSTSADPRGLYSNCQEILLERG